MNNITRNVIRLFTLENFNISFNNGLLNFYQFPQVITSLFLFILLNNYTEHELDKSYLFELPPDFSFYWISKKCQENKNYFSLLLCTEDDYEFFKTISKYLLESIVDKKYLAYVGILYSTKRFHSSKEFLNYAFIVSAFLNSPEIIFPRQNKFEIVRNIFMKTVFFFIIIHFRSLNEVILLCIVH